MDAQATTRQARLQRLGLAIELHPQAPINYLLRAEIFVEQHHYHLAYADFQQALDLAKAHYQQHPWGIPEQAIIDRAELGLKQLQHILRAEKMQTEE